MVVIRKPQSIYQARGEIQNGEFHGRWHFSFDQYHDPQYMHFGTLRVFNDDTLSPGAVWPLHPHRDIEVVTYCADGEFRHADEHGLGAILERSWVQHTTVGRGMYHSELNNRPDAPMRFIQMWFYPFQKGLEPSVEVKKVELGERTNLLLPVVSNKYPDALPIRSDAEVFSCSLEGGRSVDGEIKGGYGAYIYVLEGGPVMLDGHLIPALGAAKVSEEDGLRLSAQSDAELLFVRVPVVLSSTRRQSY